jgi:hypothetical protein
MTKLICAISASSWFYYKEICYDARSHERKIIHEMSLTRHSIKLIQFNVLLCNCMSNVNW